MANTMVPYDTAGVMRCCIQSLDQYILHNPIDAPVGTVVWCQHEAYSWWVLIEERWVHRGGAANRRGLVWRQL